MGVVVSVVTAVTGLIGAIFGLVEGIRSASSSGDIAPNPVMEELEGRMREEQRRAEAAEAQRQQAEEHRRWAEEQQRLAEEEGARAAEAARRAEEERLRAEDVSRRAQEDARNAVEARQRAEDERRRADEERERADEERRAAEEEKRRFEENSRRAEEDRYRADEARFRAEEEARRADEEKKRAEADRIRAEEQRRQADAATQAALEQQRQAEEERRKSEEERIQADQEARQAKLEQEKAEQAKHAANRAAAEAQAALEEAEKALKEGIKPVIIPTREEFEAAQRRLQYKEGVFHFAVAGISGSGKSSLINAFRGLRNNSKDPLVARTGVVETTSIITRFADPNPKNPFAWYDVPGAGTLEIPDWVYFNAQGLYIFDCIIVLTDNRFTQTDEAILRNCARFNIPAYIVRSKSQQHIHNVLQDLPCEDDDEDDPAMRWTMARNLYIAETRASVARNLDHAGLPQQKVYMVDKATLVEVVRGKQPKEFLDELELLRDLLSETHARRVKTRPRDPKVMHRS